MSVSMLARAALRQRAVAGARSIHTTAPVRSSGHYHHLPFAFPGNKKAAFGAKVFVYLLTGFSIPFIASAYQLKKSAGAA
ncbi:hypothetical protein HGRIS_009772 [Hohenbuehelia grisea]|uniref:Cytochrome c oxidase subunit 8, mitochondrial n=1 Tax=Hohenbuehelia grisea TaxID=104357 RepID=A0ABR3J270_9AGAR